MTFHTSRISLICHIWHSHVLEEHVLHAPANTTAAALHPGSLTVHMAISHSHPMSGFALGLMSLLLMVTAMVHTGAAARAQNQLIAPAAVFSSRKLLCGFSKCPAPAPTIIVIPSGLSKVDSTAHIQYLHMHTAGSVGQPMACSTGVVHTMAISCSAPQYMPDR